MFFSPSNLSAWPVTITPCGAWDCIFWCHEPRLKFRSIRRTKKIRCKGIGPLSRNVEAELGKPPKALNSATGGSSVLTTLDAAVTPKRSLLKDESLREFWPRNAVFLPPLSLRRASGTSLPISRPLQIISLQCLSQRAVLVRIVPPDTLKSEIKPIFNPVASSACSVNRHFSINFFRWKHDVSTNRAS